MATTVAVTKDSYARVSQTHQSLARFLADADVFRCLQPAEIGAVAAMGWSQRTSRGQIIYCEGEILPHLYVIESGSVKLVRASEDGKELIVGLLGRGECFGNVAHSQPSGCFAQALEDSTLFAVPRQTLRRVAASKPSFALDLLELAERQSTAAQAHAARLAFDTVPQRLAQLLLRISDPRYGTLRYPVNQTDLANLIGSSRETVCAILSRLRRRGVVSIVKGRIRVLQRERLPEIR